jgi:hypothetical protein
VSHPVQMAASESVVLCPITAGDLGDVASFLHAELNSRLSASLWAEAIKPSWPTTQPNHGFMLVHGGHVVGSYVAFYSQRRVNDQTENVCNLAAWCVLDSYRSHGVRLLKAMLDQRGYTFTDLSPSGNVVPLNRRLNFSDLDTATALVINWPFARRQQQILITSDPEAIEACLNGRDREIYLDHARAPAAHHLVVQQGERRCYVIFRRDRRKQLPLFASILYIGDTALFQRAAHQVYSYLLTRFGLVATLLENRLGVVPPRFAILLRSSRPKMFRSNRLLADQVDYLYSELTCVPW